MAQKYPIRLHSKRFNLISVARTTFAVGTSRKVSVRGMNTKSLFPNVEDKLKRSNLHCCEEEVLLIVLICGTSGKTLQV